MKKQIIATLITAATLSTGAMANEYNISTGVATGTDGLNFNVELDRNDDTAMSFYRLDAKGVYGEALGWNSDDNQDDSIDTLRVRMGEIHNDSKMGMYMDAEYDRDIERLDASAGIIGEIKTKQLTIRPFATFGLVAQNTIESIGPAEVEAGYTIPGTYATVGAYTEYQVTERVSVQYNPLWKTAVSGKSHHTEHGFIDNKDKGHGSILINEFAIAYKINTQVKLQYVAEWDQHTSLSDGEQMIELKYQF